MNKAYRLIWSIAKDAWVIVAEDVKTKSGRPGATVKIAVAMIMLAGAVSVNAADLSTNPALPTAITWGNNPNIHVTSTTGTGGAVSYALGNYKTGLNNLLSLAFLLQLPPIFSGTGFVTA